MTIEWLLEFCHSSDKIKQANTVDHMIFLWASIFQNQKIRDVFSENLTFSKNHSNLDQPKNFNLINLINLIIR